jgi:hypothetical protein
VGYASAQEITGQLVLLGNWVGVRVKVRVRVSVRVRVWVSVRVWVRVRVP